MYLTFRDVSSTLLFKPEELNSSSYSFVADCNHVTCIPHHILYRSKQHGLWEERNGSRERKNNQFLLVYNILFYELLRFQLCATSIYWHLKNVLGFHDPLRISYSVVVKSDSKIIIIRSIMSKPQDKIVFFKKEDTAYCTLTEMLIWTSITKTMRTYRTWMSAPFCLVRKCIFTTHFSSN